MTLSKPDMIRYFADMYADLEDDYDNGGFTYEALVDAFIAGYNKCLRDNDIREDY